MSVSVWDEKRGETGNGYTEIEGQLKERDKIYKL